MASGIPMLFIPPQPPLQLRPHVTVVLGRSRSCDLRLSTTDASRRHAEIVTVGDEFVLRDLASTNGTFVNGEPIGERVLRPGDRIQIGSSTITFCQVDPAQASSPENGEDKTVVSERPVAGEIFRGDLAEIPPFAVLQLLEMGRKTGVLEIDATSRGKGRLWLSGGSPVHAETDAQSGFDAAVDIVQAEAGSFTFRPGTDAPEPTITASVTELVLEASRMLDERSAD